jgi:uracil-DNA glycosylase family 4
MSYSLHTLTNPLEPAEASEQPPKLWLRFALEFSLLFGGAGLVLVFLSLLSYNVNDAAWSTSGTSPHVHNLVGRLGAWMADLAYFSLGYSVWWCWAAGLRAWLSGFARWLRGEAASETPPAPAFSGAWSIWLGLLVVLVCSSSLEWSRLYRLEGHLPGTSGGALGYLTGMQAMHWLGFTGSALAALLGMVLGMSAGFRFSWGQLAESIGARIDNLIRSRHVKREIEEDLAMGQKALRERALACVRCPQLAASRQQVVFGAGSLEASILFVGEAPGAEEETQGEPFVGEAGQLFTKILQAAGLSRAEVYITTLLKCRPAMPGSSADNRKPTPEETAACLPYLYEQIDLIRPQVIVALGATAVEGLLGKTAPISKLRGQWQSHRGTPLMPTYHPAYLLRNPSLQEKRKVWEDLLQVMEKVGMPISDKQRGFFLKA